LKTNFPKNAGPIWVGVSILLSLSCGGDPEENSQDLIEEVEDAGPETPSGPSAQYLLMSESQGLGCNTQSPGADIDAARLYADPTQSQLLATLGSCSWYQEGSACASNNFNDPQAAQGMKDGSVIGGFVSLNGGSIVCKWSANESLFHGNLISVFEMGSAVDPEEFEIRACVDAAATDCGPAVQVKSDGQTIPAGLLLP
jgi:hypothetical protein